MVRDAARDLGGGVFCVLRSEFYLPQKKGPPLGIGSPRFAPKARQATGPGIHPSFPLRGRWETPRSRRPSGPFLQHLPAEQLLRCAWSEPRCGSLQRALQTRPPQSPLNLSVAMLLMLLRPVFESETGRIPRSCSSMEQGGLVFDMVYSPLETELLRAANSCGLATSDGLMMLVGQAATAFERFFGVKPPREHDAELRRLLTS